MESDETIAENSHVTIKTTKAPSPAGGYSQGLVVGDLIFVSGQAPLDPSTGEVVGSSIQEQTQAALGNVEAVLEEAGASLSDVVKATVHLADLVDFQAFDATYRSFWPSGHFPTRTTVQSVLPGIKIEIDVIAVRSRRR
jgi:2-iminobutanoate/2-iminopropanoate deaminase